MLPALLLEELEEELNEELMLVLPEDCELRVEEEPLFVALALAVLEDEDAGTSFAPIMYERLTAGPTELFM